MRGFSKIISAAVVAASLCTGFVSCASAKIEAADVTPVAIFSIVSNDHLPWYELDKNGKLKSTGRGLLATVINPDQSFESKNKYGAIDRLNFAEDSIKRVLSENLNIEFIDKETVINSKKYKNLNSVNLNGLNNFVSPEGYRIMEYPKSYGVLTLLKDVKANSGLILSFRFYREKISGTKANGESGAVVIMRASFFDKKGKKIFEKTYTGRSTDTATARDNDLDKEKLYELYNEAIENLMFHLCADLS